MKKFTHIRAFHDVVKYARRVNGNPRLGPELALHGPVTFRGTVKLHGSNAGVACLPDGLIAQSRNRPLSLDDDNLGFAAFVARPEVTAALRALEAEIRAEVDHPPDRRLTLFGEWCGPGIQKRVAINGLPSKQLVLFAVVLDAGEEARYVDAVPRLGERFAELGIFSILDGPVWEQTVDFVKADTVAAFVERATALTEQVEEACPWGARFDAEGTGEGIVWVPVGAHFGRTDLYFKTKGEKHRKTGGRGVKIPIDPKVMAGIAQFVEYAVTEGRLAQGVEVLREMGTPIEMPSMGAYLKWVGGDVKRECAAELEASGLEWKAVAKAVALKARMYFIAEVRTL